MSLEIEFSERLKALPPYLFVEIDKAKRAAKAEGRDIIDLGIGDPDSSTPQVVIDKLCETVQDGANHHYPLDAGVTDLRTNIATWFEKRFNVALDANTEIYPLIGSKEGLAHLPLGIINQGDRVLLTDPCYPAYQAAVSFAGGRITRIPLKEKNGFLPDLNKVRDAKNVKAMFVNYPNNPTAGVATKEFYEELVKIAKEKGIILISDMAYSEVYYDEQKPISILEIEGAKDVAIEFHSLSKTYFMTGWRIGWACGNPKLVAALAKVKSNYDSGVFHPIQHAAIAALNMDPELVGDMRRLYQERRDTLALGLRGIGWKVTPPKASFYVWSRMPSKFKNSMEMAKAALDQADIIMTPGVGFGKSGEGYVRMALTVSKERLIEATTRLQKIL